MEFWPAVKSAFNRYFDFSARSSRSEYWWFYLFCLLVNAFLLIVDADSYSDAGFVVLAGIFNLAIFIPSLAVSVRRLHDTDRSGWWLLIALIPLVGFIVLLIWSCTRGTSGDNRFGPDPLAWQAAP